MKLRLTGAGFDRYTGQMGVVYFENGLSQQDVMPNDAIRIAGSIGAEWENGAPANLGAIYTQNLMTPAPDITQQSGLELLKSVTGHVNANQAQANADQVASMTTGIKKQDDAPVEKVATATANTAKQKYSKEALEEVADKDGIAGLREIGNELGVKANSITALIQEILHAQG